MKVFYTNGQFYTGRLKIDQSPIFEQIEPVNLADQSIKVINVISGFKRHEANRANAILSANGFYLADIIDANDPDWYQYIYIRPERVIKIESEELRSLEIEPNTVIVSPSGNYLIATESRGQKVVRINKRGVLIEP